MRIQTGGRFITERHCEGQCPLLVVDRTSWPCPPFVLMAHTGMCNDDVLRTLVVLLKTMLLVMTRFCSDGRWPSRLQRHPQHRSLPWSSYKDGILYSGRWPVRIRYLGCARNRLSHFDVFYRCCCYPPTSYILRYAFSLFSVLKQSDFVFQLNRRAFVDRYATV